MARRQYGVVLTYVEDLEQLEDCVRRGGYDTIKVVTGWGVEGGWTSENKARVLHMVPNVIVRTEAGDPSASRPDQNNDFLHPERVQQELAEWYHIRPTITIELGNEPNINDPDDDFIWKYRYYLAASIVHCRQAFPRARLIAGGLLVNNARRFCEIAHDVMRDCDYIGMHVYEYYGFHAAHQLATTNDLKHAIDLYKRFFPNKPWYITEYGINDSNLVTNAEKGNRYAGLIHFHESHPKLPANVKGAVYYHLGMKGDLHPEYHIYPEGDATYRQRVATLPRDLPQIPGEGVQEAVVSQVTALIDSLEEQIQALQALRHEAASDSGEAFTVANDLELHQLQALQATLEAALQCAQNNDLVAEQLITAAASRVAAWSKRKKQTQ